MEMKVNDANIDWNLCIFCSVLEENPNVLSFDINGELLIDFHGLNFKVEDIIIKFSKD